VALVTCVILLKVPPAELARYSVLVMMGLFPDVDKLPDGIKYHRSWFTHSTFHLLAAFFILNDFFFLVAAVIVGIHLLMDIRRGKPGGSYCIVKPSGKRMSSRRSTAWLASWGSIPLIIMIIAIACTTRCIVS